MEETLMEYVKDLPPYMQIVIVIVLVIGVLLVPSLVSIGDFATSVRNRFSEIVNNSKQRKEEKLQRELEERAFRQNVNDIMTNIPDIYAKINSVVHDIDTVISSSKENNEIHEKFEATLSRLAIDIEQLSERSDTTDNELSAHSKINRDNIEYLINRVDKLTSTVENMDDKVKLLVDGDIDDFRTFLIQVYNQCIAGDHVLTKREISVLKNKYERYRAEGGNGWAKRLMEELAEELENDELLELCNSSNDK